MISFDRAKELLHKHAHVTAKTAQRAYYDEGEIIGYSPAPMVLIRKADGSTFWWLAELVEVKEPLTDDA